MATNSQLQYIPRYSKVGRDLPFRGDPSRLYIREELEAGKGATVFTDGKVLVLDLSDPNDILKYEELLTSCANGRAELMVQMPVYDDVEHKFRVLLTYVSRFMEDAEAVKRKKLTL